MAEKSIDKGPKGMVEKALMQLTLPGLATKTNFFRLMAVAQEAGLGMRESLKSIIASEQNDAMKKIILSILEDINGGHSLGYAVGCHTYFFSTDEIELIRAAEKMGNMPDVLREIAGELENSQKINSKIKGAIMYPTALIIFTIVAVAILLIFVIPTIIDLFPDQDKLPGITKFMINASDFIKTTRYIMLITVGIAVTAFKMAYANIMLFKKFVDHIMLKTPAVKDVVKGFYMYKFSKLLGDFGHAGVGPAESLEQMMRIFDNYFYKRKALSMRNDLEAGFTFSESIEGSDLFDPVLVQIIMVGEQTGNMSDILITMSKFYRYELEVRINTLMGFIEPIMMGLIASVIGVVIASIFLPLGSLLDVVTG